MGEKGSDNLRKTNSERNDGKDGQRQHSLVHGLIHYAPLDILLLYFIFGVAGAVPKRCVLGKVRLWLNVLSKLRISVETTN